MILRSLLILTGEERGCVISLIDHPGLEPQETKHVPKDSTHFERLLQVVSRHTCCIPQVTCSILFKTNVQVRFGKRNRIPGPGVSRAVACSIRHIDNS